MENYDHDLPLAMEQWFDLAEEEERRDAAECDGCGLPWPMSLIEKCPVTGCLLCPDCSREDA